jgi:hypothetical protein
MPVGLSCSAELRVRNRNEVVNEIHWPNAGNGNPLPKSGRIQPGVTYVEIEPPTAAAIRTAEVPQRTGNEAGLERCAPFAKQSEQFL